MTQKLNIPLPDELIEKLSELDYFLLAQLEDESSPIRKYVSLAISRIVLENSTTEERELFQDWLKTDEQKAIDYVLEKAVLYQEQIYQELADFFRQAKGEVNYG